MRFVKILLSLALCATIALACVNVYTQNCSGRYSSVSVITEEERAWILERFEKEFNGVEEYISAANAFARAHFSYDDDKAAKSIGLQYYDFQSICKGDDIVGICFDFAVLFKNMTLVLMEEGYLPDDIRVYVVDVAYTNQDKDNHSYNVVSLPSGDNYYLDLTKASVRAKNNLEPDKDFYVFRCSIEEYGALYNERVYNLH